MNRDETTLLDIFDCANLVIQFKQGHTRKSFSKDIKTQSAILHQLIIMGEAVKRLSSDFRENYPEVPWREIAGMRDRLVHGYDQIDLQTVWHTASVNVPELLKQLKPLISE